MTGKLHLSLTLSLYRRLSSFRLKDCMTQRASTEVQRCHRQLRGLYPAATRLFALPVLASAGRSSILLAAAPGRSPSVDLHISPTEHGNVHRRVKILVLRANVQGISMRLKVDNGLLYRRPTCARETLHAHENLESFAFYVRSRAPYSLYDVRNTFLFPSSQ